MSKEKIDKIVSYRVEANVITPELKLISGTILTVKEFKELPKFYQSRCTRIVALPVSNDKGMTVIGYVAKSSYNVGIHKIKSGEEITVAEYKKLPKTIKERYNPLAVPAIQEEDYEAGDEDSEQDSEPDKDDSKNDADKKGAGKGSPGGENANAETEDEKPPETEPEDEPGITTKTGGKK